LADVQVQQGELLESALRRFKRKVQQEDIVKEVRRHSLYSSRAKKRVKEVAARRRGRQKIRKEQE